MSNLTYIILQTIILSLYGYYVFRKYKVRKDLLKKGIEERRMREEAEEAERERKRQERKQMTIDRITAIQEKNRLSGRICYSLMEKWKMHEIDSEEDIILCEQIYKLKLSGK